MAQLNKKPLSRKFIRSGIANNSQKNVLKLASLTVGIALWAVLLSACSDQTQGLNPALEQVRAQRAQEFGPCERTSTTQAAGLVSESRCLIFNRPENPDDPASRLIPLQVMVLPSLKSASTADPLVILAGGPGQAATDMARLGQIFRTLRQDRDIVLLDQRGTGKLSPMQCQTSQDQLTDLSLDHALSVQTGILNRCLAEMDASPEYYTTDLAIADLEALRIYLGYAQFNLWGASYGTRVALAFLKAYPDSVRTVVIDGVAPAELLMPLYIERDASRALDKIFEDCSADPDCATRFPELVQHFLDLGQRLSEAQTLALNDPLTDQPLSLTVDRDWLHSALRTPLYGRATQRLVPFIIEQAYQGNYAPLLSVSSLDGDISEAMFLSVICSEDVARIDPGKLALEQAEPYSLKSRLLNIPVIEACKLWPTRVIPQSFFDPVVSSKPVLIFSGDLDPVTPPTWGDSVMPGLSNSRHLIVEGFAHNTLGSVCTIDMITKFIDSTDLITLDTACLSNLKRRPFFTGAGGSSASD